MPLRVLVVCTANICRSPAAATLLRRELWDVPFIDVSSAGVAAMTGAAACDLSSALVGEAGVEAPPGAALPGSAGHASRLVTAQLAEQSDLLLGLDRSHRAALAQLAPATRSRTFTLRQAARLSDRIVADLRSGRLPPGAPALPSGPEQRLRWFVAELDAARGASAPGGAGPDHHQWHDDDVPDPHVLGYQIHPMALELIRDATAGLVAGVRRVLAADENPQPASPEHSVGSDRNG